MSASCTLCAILNGELDPDEVPLEFLLASSARMVTHFVLHPSVGLGHSIVKLFTLIGAHHEVEAGVQGAQHYADIAAKWRDIVALAERQRASTSSRSVVH